MEGDLLERLSAAENVRYRHLVYKAVVENCQEAPGTSRQRIEKYIQHTESREDRFPDPEYVRLALRDALRRGAVVRITGFGLNGSFAPASWNAVGFSGEQPGNSVERRGVENIRDVSHPYSRPLQIGGGHKTILKTPKKRFRVKRVDGVFPESTRRVTFAKSPTIVFISPKHKKRGRSMRCARAR